MIVAAYNPTTDDLEKTYVSSYTATGAVTLPVKNNNGFVGNGPILIGAMGSESAELSVPSAVSADKFSLTIPATKFNHSADDPVYVMDFDKIRFYRSATLTGTYLLVATVPIDVDNADKVTVWDDVNSDPTYFYKTSFFNSITNDETIYSNGVPATGYALETAGNIIDKVVRRVRDQSFTVLSIDAYLDICDEVGSDLITQAHKPYLFLRRTVSLNAVAGQNYIDLPDTLWKFKSARLLTASGNFSRTSEVRPISLEVWLNKYGNTNYAPQDNILQYAVDEENKRLMIYPTPLTNKAGVALVTFFKSFDHITEVGNVIETPNDLIYRYKLMAEYYSAKSEVDRQWAALAAKYEGKYGQEVVKMQRTNRLDTGTPREFAPRAGQYRRRRYTL